MTTQVYPNNGQINDILVDDEFIFFAANSKNILKYEFNSDLISKINTSSSCNYNINKIDLKNNNIVSYIFYIVYIIYIIIY